jgi:hypothetical protein
MEKESTVKETGVPSLSPDLRERPGIMTDCAFCLTDKMVYGLDVLIGM